MRREAKIIALLLLAAGATAVSRWAQGRILAARLDQAEEDGCLPWASLSGQGRQ